MKSKEKKSTYGTLSNLRFMARRAREFDKSLFLYMPMPMAGRLTIAVLGIFIPKIIIDSLTNGLALSSLLMIIAAIALALTLSQLLITYSVITSYSIHYTKLYDWWKCFWENKCYEVV